jgi:hypothetical protein
MMRCFADAGVHGIRILECYATQGAETFYRVITRLTSVGPTDVMIARGISGGSREI